ncbi:MAG: hypothetical protein WD716_11630 [Fimbriimonadaceae bacterium]
MPFYFSFLSTRPNVHVTAQLVTSKSPWLTHVLSLGFYSRTVVIDSRTRTVRIRVRFLWGLWRRHTFSFDEVAYVTYGMRETGTTASYVSGEREGSETFHVGVTLKDQRHYTLATFAGEGEYSSEHAFLWEWPSHKLKELTDTVGTQQEESMNFVDLVCYRIGVTLGP